MTVIPPRTRTLGFFAIALAATPHTMRAQIDAQAAEQPSAHTRQESQPSSLFIPRLGIEVGAQGGVLTPTHALTTGITAPSGTPLAIQTATPALLQTAHTAILSSWDAPHLHVDAALSLAFASTRGTTTTRPLGLFRLSTRRGPLTLSLGFQQTTGITTYQRTTGGDTALYNPGDTLSSRGSDTALTHTPQTPTPRTTAVIAELVGATDVVGGLGWNTAYSSIQFLSGLRTNDSHASPWTGIDAALYLGASNALTFSARRQSRSAAISTPAFTLGFRSTYWHWGKSTPVADTTPSHTSHTRAAQPFVFVTTTGDTTALDVYLPTAHRASVMGDATDWTPCDMIRSTNGWWHIPLHVSTSVSRIQLKTDDTDWRPIPGLPATRDEYGGTVSLLTTNPQP